MRVVVPHYKVFVVIKILYISKNATLRCYMKLDFNVTYHFGHNSGICLPFLLKVGSKCPYLEGVSHRQPVWTEPVQTGSVQIGFTILKARNRNQRSSLRSFCGCVDRT